MITLKQILSQICLGDWFMSLDLKDAYFHIQVAPHHRRVLRFAFKGVDYQYKILPFGLSLAPRTFTRCMDAALSPLRQMGIRILNYLNDWLILAQLLAVLTSHKDLLLSHLWRFSTAWYGTARHDSLRTARLSSCRFAFPRQFSTALEWAGLITCRYSCAASTAVTLSYTRHKQTRNKGAY